MATVFEILRRVKAIFNNFYIGLKTFNGAILKSVDSIIKNLVIISESIIATVNDVKVLFKAAKELIYTVKE